MACAAGQARQQPGVDRARRELAAPPPARARRRRGRAARRASWPRSTAPPRAPSARAAGARARRPRAPGSASSVRASCHTIAGAIGRPVARSQTTTVSRWLAMPTARTSAPRRGVGQRRRDDLPGARPDLLRVVLDQAGRGVGLAVGRVALRHDRARLVEQQAARPGRPLVDGAHEAGHARMVGAGRPRYPAAVAVPGPSLHDAASMRATDRAAIEAHGVPGVDLMAGAGAAAEVVLRERFRRRPARRGRSAAAATTAATAWSSRGCCSSAAWRRASRSSPRGPTPATPPGRRARAREAGVALDGVAGGRPRRRRPGRRRAARHRVRRPAARCGRRGHRGHRGERPAGAGARRPERHRRVDRRGGGDGRARRRDRHVPRREARPADRAGRVVRGRGRRRRRSASPTGPRLRRRACWRGPPRSPRCRRGRAAARSTTRGGSRWSRARAA